MRRLYGSARSCAAIDSTLYDSGHSAMDTLIASTAINVIPVVLTEFGSN